MKTNKVSIPRSVHRLLAALVLTAVGLAMLASAANAEFGLRPDRDDPSRPDFHADVFDSAGELFTQAGGHPFEARVSFGFRTVEKLGLEAPDQNAKDILVDLPPGLLGNPQAMAFCEESDFSRIEPVSQRSSCPVDSQVGTTTVSLINQGDVYTIAPIYNMRPSRNEIAAFQFNIVSVKVRMSATVRSNGDYGLTVRAIDINETAALKDVVMSFWGVPSDSLHDPLRGYTEIGLNLPGFRFPLLIRGAGGLTSSAFPRAFLTLPVECSHGPYDVSMRTNSWQNPGDWKSYTTQTQSGVTGCENLSFEPSVRLRPDEQRAGLPSGLAVDIDVPQSDRADTLGTPELRKVVMRLPTGLRVSPSSASGLGACTDAQLALDSTGDATCPESAKLGDVSVTTPLLGEPLTGPIYLGTQQPNQLLRLFLVLRGPGGLIIKLPGVVDPDPATGQLTAMFDNNPQLPFSNLSLRFKGGPRAALSMPPTCGTYTTTAELTSWATGLAPVTRSDSFVVNQASDGGPCRELGFTPSFRAGTADPVGGKDTSFSLTFGRDDDDQDLREIAVNMPKGLLARIGDVPLCGDAAAAAGTCGDESRVGSTTTGAGPGSNPFFLPGRVYMTGPYKGAPYGMSIVVPAVAGPLDLGTVVVRAAIFVDKTTTALRIVSDPLPSVLMGIPLQIRTVNVNVDRSRFMINPTSCNPSTVAATIGSQTGASAGASSRFQVGDCANLPFKPKMTLTVGSRGRTRRNITTPLSVLLEMSPGQANNRGVQVTLPKTLNARLRVVNQACALAEFNAGRCGERARVGSAVAVTPLLREPLTGPAYFVRNPARRLPDLMVPLRGPVEVDLTGKVTVPRDLTLRTDFDTIPDVPITSFRLDLVAGRQGVIGAVNNLCTADAKRRSVAALRFRGQNGDLVAARQQMVISGCAPSRRTTRARAQRRAGRRAQKRAQRRAQRRAAKARKAAQAAQRLSLK